MAKRRYGRESLFDPLLGNMHVPAKISWLNLSAYWPEIARRPVLGLRSTFLRRYETAGGRTPMRFRGAMIHLTMRYTKNYGVNALTLLEEHMSGI